MATSIHHGPPGSYKSFTLVQRFAIPALIEGRVIVTNIRGFDDIDRVKDQFPDQEFSENARIIWVDTTTQAGRTRMAKWFHWVPFGALIIIDEVQQVYPDRRDFKLESLDTFTPEPGEEVEDIGLKEGRPEDVFTAYDKQRHYNWDIFCSTPNIAKVKKEIREVSEWAFRHRDISGLLPWKKDTWIEHQHDPESNGKSSSHCVGSPTQYKADPRVFKCYASTATGEHVKSKAGRSILSDPKILAICVLIGLCIVFMVYFYGKRFGSKETAHPVAAPAETAPRPPDNNNPSRPDVLVPPAVSSDVAVNVEPLLNLDRAHVLQWAFNGLTVDDLKLVPVSCEIRLYSVYCEIPKDPVLLRVAKKKFCYPLRGFEACTVIFSINQPQNQQPETDDKTTTLAKNIPF